MTEFAGYQGFAGDRSSEKVYKYRSSSFTNQMAQPMCFQIGDKVRIAVGTYVVTFPDKRIEYDLKDRIGIIKLRYSFSKYQVEVEIDGVKRLITVPETHLSWGVKPRFTTIEYSGHSIDVVEDYEEVKKRMWRADL